jgi:hypothetical protein
LLLFSPYFYFGLVALSSSLGLLSTPLWLDLSNYIGLVALSSSLGLLSTPLWLDLSNYIDSPLTTSLLAVPLPSFEIFVVSMDI